MASVAVARELPVVPPASSLTLSHSLSLSYQARCRGTLLVSLPCSVCCWCCIRRCGGSCCTRCTTDGSHSLTHSLSTAIVSITAVVAAVVAIDTATLVLLYPPLPSITPYPRVPGLLYVVDVAVAVLWFACVCVLCAWW